MKQGTRFK